MDPDILTVGEAASLLRMEPAKVVELLMAGELPGRNTGNEWLTTRRAILGFVDGLSMQSGCCGPGMCCPPAMDMATSGAPQRASGRATS
ncbi:MAG: hypothetical protein AMXMBFR84_44920 [Candidatus Hydrogenedentota bacterium]